MADSEITSSTPFNPTEDCTDIGSVSTNRTDIGTVSSVRSDIGSISNQSTDIGAVRSGNTREPVKNDSLANSSAITENDAMPKQDAATLAAERIEHLRTILKFDRMVLSEHPKSSIIVGTDEVGRGCLAGPVVACAVILPEIPPGSQLEEDLCRLNDSKLVPPDARSILAARLREVCQFAIAEASVEEIDEINILQASLLAMRRAVRRLSLEAPPVILIDGNKKIPSLRQTQITVIGGDSKSAAIAAASVIAKVHRDAFMMKLHKKFPDYVWNSNKGYRSPAHYEALNRFGMTKWHRKSFNCGQNNEVDTDVDPDFGDE